MKKLKAWVSVIPMLAIACSDDYHSPDVKTDISFKIKSLPATVNAVPNPFENAGVLQNQILESYQSGKGGQNTLNAVVQRVDSIAALQPGLQPGALAEEHQIQVAWILAHQSTALPQILSASVLGAQAKLSFDNLAGIMLRSDHPLAAEEGIACLVTYREAVLQNTSYTQEDKRILLTTCSFWEYSLRRKRRTDLDWETSVGHIAAMLYGAERSLDVAVRISSVAGLCHNHGVSPGPK